MAGLGFGEKVHLPALYNSETLLPMAIWHPSKNRLKECYTRNASLKPYQDWSSLLNDPNIKAVIIATPPEPRFRLALEALNAGKHLLLEKPIALKSSEISELQKIALSKNLSVAVDFEYRAVPLFMQAKKMLDNNLIGTPWLIKLDWLMSSRADESREWNWYSQQESGGGVIGALGTHAFDLLHWFFGPTKNINAITSTSIKERYNPQTDRAQSVTSEDICLANLELSDINSNLSIPVQVALSSISRNGRGCWLEIYGSNGTLKLGSDNQKDYVHGFALWFAEKNKALSQIKPDNDFLFEKTWEDGRIAPVLRVHKWWAESIISGFPMIPGLIEGLNSQKVCEKIIESSNSGMNLSL
ncbi:Oxidoreductase [Prochlorococcus sp. MIT 0603]|nr:Oxidoreductase [Prochlorococcus sp. MIT 0603]